MEHTVSLTFNFYEVVNSDCFDLEETNRWLFISDAKGVEYSRVNRINLLMEFNVTWINYKLKNLLGFTLPGVKGLQVKITTIRTCMIGFP